MSPPTQADAVADAVARNQEVVVLHRAGDWNQALVAAKQALLANEAALGPTHLEVATSLYQLGTLYQRRGQYDEADHPALARTLSNLALVYVHQRRFAAAEPLQSRSVAILL